MPTLTDPKLPPTSPPAIPPPPQRVELQNVPPRGGVFVAPAMTEEEIKAATEEELAAQEQDMIQAKAEEVESNTAMAALEGAFVPNGIFRHRGVGPLQYETKRGLLKVFSGDLVCHLQGPTNPEAPPEEWILEEEFIALSEPVLTALLFTVEPRLFPENLHVRASRIGEERRAEETEPPVVLVRNTGESDADFAKRKATAEEERNKKILAARKKKEEERKSKLVKAKALEPPKAPEVKK